MALAEIPKRDANGAANSAASTRIFRLVEGALVMLFLLQSARAVFAILVSTVSRALNIDEVDPLIATSHLVLVMVLALPWLAPRRRTLLPRVLLLSAVGVALGRLAVSVPLQLVQLYGGMAALGFGGVYLSSLLRANRRMWVTVIIVGLTFEQLLRAGDTYDLTLHARTDIPVGALRLQMPVWVLQAVLCVILLAVAVYARRSARHEPYEPGFLTTLGGLAFGAFLALEFLALGLANVVARWANVPYPVILPWLLLATGLPLLPGVRDFVGQTFHIFDDQVRGWVWLFIFLLMLIVGNRLVGIGSAGALILAQFMAVMLLWWVPIPPEADEIEQVGPSLSFGLFAFAVLVYAYSLTFELGERVPLIQGQVLFVLLIAGALVGLPRLFWREVDPWTEPISLPRLLPAAYVAPLVVVGLVLGGPRSSQGVPPVPEELRVATYNINSGYDERGIFQLERAALTIEASLADVVMLQEVDTGLPVSYGVDEAVYLGRRLGMEHVYLPMVEHSRGVAILSRWPLTQQTGTAIQQNSPMAAVRARLVDPPSGRTIDIVSAELMPSVDESLRLQQLGYLFSLFDPAAPTVLGVDLGTGTTDIAYLQLTPVSFQDADVLLGIEHGFTVPASDPTERHDYVMVRGLVPHEARHVESLASDHRLVVVRLTAP